MTRLPFSLGLATVQNEKEKGQVKELASFESDSLHVSASLPHVPP